jgi:cystathionine beta-lyase/cystathionine gamma-synthase
MAPLKHDLSYILNHLGEEREQYFNAVSPPIIQSSNFACPTVDDLRQALKDEEHYHFYTRGNNPTVAILRQKVAALEGADDALIFSSGMAAISAAIFAFVQQGDHVVCVKKPYSWTDKLLNDFLPRYGIETTFVDGTDVAHFREAIQANTKVLFLESPDSITFEMQDLEAVSKLAHEYSLTTIIDNSYASPLFQQPLDFGIDVVTHSATKYLNGHSDVVAGVLCASQAIVSRIYHSEFMTLGGIISPHDAWLMLRGLRTLQVRMERISASTEKIVAFLEEHPKVELVYYPFAKDHPQRALAGKQMIKGAGQFSATIKADGLADIERFCNNLQRFLLACSWGGHESLVLPTCALMDSPDDDIQGIPWNLIRFYIGLEEPDVLIEDLKEGLEKL